MRLLKALLFCFFPLTSCFATSQPYTFMLHPNRVFVETGSYYGEGIINAMCGGFKEIHSIEYAPKYYFLCKEKYQNHERVHIHFGDSGKKLYDVIKEIDEPMTFWLDAQFTGDDTAFNGTMTPLLAELDQIKKHHINTHTILIDDVRLFGTWYLGNITKEQIIEKIYEINPNYTIRYEMGFVPEDILVAEVK